MAKVTNYRHSSNICATKKSAKSALHKLTFYHINKAFCLHFDREGYFSENVQFYLFLTDILVFLHKKLHTKIKPSNFALFICARMRVPARIYDEKNI